MYSHPLVKPAFHLSWFLLLLGGISLMEKPGWGIPGAIMLLIGVLILAFTFFAIYLHKTIIQEPGWLLLVSSVLLVLLVAVQVIDGKFELALILSILVIPVLLGWTRMRGVKAGGKSKSKRKG